MYKVKTFGTDVQVFHVHEELDRLDSQINAFFSSRPDARLVGVSDMPVTDDIFYARAGQDAFWGKKKIRISEAPTINDESVLFTFSRFHQYYRSTFPGKIRNLGCASAHICYVAMGRADAAVIANESFQGLAAARVILEAAANP